MMFSITQQYIFNTNWIHDKSEKRIQSNNGIIGSNQLLTHLSCIKYGIYVIKVDFFRFNEPNWIIPFLEPFIIFDVFRSDTLQRPKERKSSAQSGRFTPHNRLYENVLQKRCFLSNKLSVINLEVMSYIG